MRCEKDLKELQQAGPSIYFGDWEMEVLLEGVHDSLCLFVAQEAVVDEDAVQPLAQDFVHQSCRHCAIHTAREGTDDVILGTNLSLTPCFSLNLSLRLWR